MMTWPPMNAVIPPTAKEIESMLRRRDIARVKLIGVLLAVGGFVGCASKIDTPSMGPQIATASATTHDVSTDIKSKSSDISTNADHAFTLAPQVKQFTDPIKLDTTYLIGDAGKLDAVTTELQSLKDQSAAKDKQLADAIADKDAAVAKANSWFSRAKDTAWIIFVICIVGGVTCIVCSFYSFAALLPLKPIGIAASTFGGIGFALLEFVARYEVEIAAGVGIGVIGLVIYGIVLLCRHAKANVEIVQTTEHAKTWLSSIADKGVTALRELFGHGTTAGIADDIQSASTKKIVAKIRGKKTSMVSLAVPPPPAVSTSTTAIAA